MNKALEKLRALRVLVPDTWARELESAMRAARGHIPAAARALGVSAKTLERWLSDPTCARIERARRGRQRK